MRHRQLMRLVGMLADVGNQELCPIDGGKVAQPPLAMVIDKYSFIFLDVDLYSCVRISHSRNMSTVNTVGKARHQRI